MDTVLASLASRLGRLRSGPGVDGRTGAGAGEAQGVGKAEGPVLVYQMGKVGSTSVTAALSNGLGPERVAQVHFLSERFERRARGQARYERQLAQRRRVLDLLNGEPSRRALFVTMVRDPVTRAVSDFFENPGIYLDPSDRLATASLDAMHDAFATRAPRAFAYPAQWFDGEFRAFTGVNVLELPFDPALGYAVSRHDAFDLLILRTESMDHAFEPGMHRLLRDSPSFPVGRANAAEHKGPAGLRSRFVAGLTIDAGALEAAYANDFMRHFYAKDEIDRMRLRWAAPKA